MYKYQVEICTMKNNVAGQWRGQCQGWGRDRWAVGAVYIGHMCWHYLSIKLPKGSV